MLQRSFLGECVGRAKFIILYVMLLLLQLLFVFEKSSTSTFKIKRIADLQIQTDTDVFRLIIQSACSSIDYSNLLPLTRN